VKLVHAADLHIDSPMRGLERYEGAPVEQMRTATRRAFENLVELCITEEVALLLLAGDLYDGDWKDYSTGLFFAQQMSRLRHAGVQVALLRGNHDAASLITKHLQLPNNVTELSTKKPETVRYEQLGVAVHGQGFAKREVTKDLAAKYPEPIAGVLNLGLLHTSVTGREGHAPYAPCRLETLTSKGYDYWALGHVHQREVLSEDPWVVFSGNLQGRHIRETGAKGATLITVDDGHISSVSHRTVDAVRWCRLEVDASGLSSAYDVVDKVREGLEREAAAAEGRPLAARVIVTGACAAHGALHDDPERWDKAIRSTATDVSDELWLEKVALRTGATYQLSDLAQRDDVLGKLVQSLESIGEDDARLNTLIDALADLQRKLPKEIRERGLDGGLRLDDRDTVRALARDAEQLLLARLLAEGGGG
jgi:exonuclease SbcD